jgi:hypothetical protein
MRLRETVGVVLIVSQLRFKHFRMASARRNCCMLNSKRAPSKRTRANTNESGCLLHEGTNNCPLPSAYLKVEVTVMWDETATKTCGGEAPDTINEQFRSHFTHMATAMRKKL